MVHLCFREPIVSCKLDFVFNLFSRKVFAAAMTSVFHCAVCSSVQSRQQNRCLLSKLRIPQVRGNSNETISQPYLNCLQRMLAIRLVVCNSRTMARMFPFFAPSESQKESTKSDRSRSLVALKPVVCISNSPWRCVGRLEIRATESWRGPLPFSTRGRPDGRHQLYPCADTLAIPRSTAYF